ncbi:Phox/Bem1p [Melia azedarach]|uniref:Phox/Bem1p n=1 Tax=Melia azedarach TaxID=155640 RepID=A0ACC1XXM5_MELAZ|nr:Phox/Bem1p [Melia azedarach]
MENFSYNSYPDSGDSSPRSREIDFENPPPWEDQQNPQQFKAKFMCSYGGKIQPRPHDNQLAYVGGETKIFAVDRTIKFASMISKLSALCGDNDVAFKYQLPGEDLDALISVTNDDDLEHMMHEYDRLYRGSAKPARMRLFLFPAGTTSSFGSEGSKSDRDRFVEAFNSGPSHGTDPKKIANNVDFLFGLEKGIPPQKIPEVVQPPPPPPSEYQVADDRGIVTDRVVYSDHAVTPADIQRQLQRLQLREQEHQVHEAMYMRKTDENLAGIYVGGGGEYSVSKVPEKLPPATLPVSVQQTTAFLPERQVPAPNYAGTVTTTPGQPEQPVYMIPAQAQGTTAVYHHHHAQTPQIIRPVTGQHGQPYYPNMQRMAPAHGPGPDVYRDQPVYNMVVPPPTHTQAPPLSAAPPPTLPQMGMVRPGGVGSVGMTAVTDTGYTQVAYDSGGRQVYYTAPGGMVVPPQYQGVGMTVSGGEMRHSGGGLSQEGKVVTKVSQASV